MTLEDARADLLERLDDQDGRRYAPDAVYTKLDRALTVALNRRLDDYVSAGGDRFDEDVDVTTDATGLADLAAYDPLAVKGVLMQPSGDVTYHPVRGIDLTVRGQQVETAYTLRVVIVRRLEVPSGQPDQPLVGGSFGGARSWEAFDDWVIATAALRLGTKDDELRKALLADLASLESSVLGHRRTPGELAWPDARRDRWWTWRQLRWAYSARDRELSLWRAGVP